MLPYHCIGIASRVEQESGQPKMVIKYAYIQSGDDVAKKLWNYDTSQLVPALLYNRPKGNSFEDWLCNSDSVNWKEIDPTLFFLLGSADLFLYIPSKLLDKEYWTAYEDLPYKEYIDPVYDRNRNGGVILIQNYMMEQPMLLRQYAFLHKFLEQAALKDIVDTHLKTFKGLHDLHQQKLPYRKEPVYLETPLIDPFYTHFYKCTTFDDFLTLMNSFEGLKQKWQSWDANSVKRWQRVWEEVASTIDTNPVKDVTLHCNLLKAVQPLYDNLCNCTDVVSFNNVLGTFLKQTLTELGNSTDPNHKRTLEQCREILVNCPEV